MALYEQHYEGQSDGTSVTTANITTYGDAAASNVYATNGTTVYSSSDKMHGSRSVLMTETAGTTSALMSVAMGGFTTTTCAARAYMKLTGRPSVPQRIMLLHGNEPSDRGGINYYTDGTVAATDITGAVLSRSSSSTQVLDLNTWYRFEMAWNISTTVGSYKMGVYVGDSTSPWFSYTSATNLNTGSFQIGEVAVGKTSNTGTLAGAIFLDDFSVNTSTSSLIGAYVASGPAISKSLTTGYVQLDATRSTPVQGGALTYSIAPSSGVIQSPNGVFYVPQTNSSAAYTLTVAEAGGGTSTQVVTIPGLTTASSSQTTVMTQKWISGAWR